MPDREKVMSGLEKCGLVHRTTEDCSGCPYKVKPGEFSKCWCVLCDDALALLKEQETRWIPVTERLPEQKVNQNTRDFEYVLCATIFGDVRPYKYGAPIGQKEAHFWNGAGCVDAYITHWMPLPEPPKEEEDYGNNH